METELRRRPRVCIVVAAPLTLKALTQASFCRISPYPSAKIAKVTVPIMLDIPPRLSS